MNEPLPYRIRPLEREDLEKVSALDKLCNPSPWSPEHFRQCLESPYDGFARRAWICLRRETLVGFACATCTAGAAELENVFVSPSHRRRGAASALMEEAAAWACGLGARWLRLEVREGNAGAQAFYRRHGFRIVGRRRRYYSDTAEDALLWDKALTERAGPSG